MAKNSILDSKLAYVTDFRIYVSKYLYPIAELKIKNSTKKWYIMTELINGLFNYSLDNVGRWMKGKLGSENTRILYLKNSGIAYNYFKTVHGTMWIYLINIDGLFNFIINSCNPRSRYLKDNLSKILFDLYYENKNMNDIDTFIRLIKNT